MAEDDKKVYPGNLARYQALREAREKAEESGQLQAGGADTTLLVIAEELAGLAYILDGIRYSTRRQGS